MSDYKIKFTEHCTDADYTKRLVYGEISAEDLSDIFTKRGLCEGLEVEPGYVYGTVTFDFCRNKDKCREIIIMPTYYDKEDDTYWDDSPVIDGYEIFKDKIDDALDYWKKGE